MKLIVNPALVQFFEKTEEGQLKAKVIQANTKALTLQLLESVTVEVQHDAGRKHNTVVGTVLTLSPLSFEVLEAVNPPAQKVAPRQTTQGCMPASRNTVHLTLDAKDSDPAGTVKSMLSVFGGA